MEPAEALVAFTEANTRVQRLINPDQDRLQARLDEVLPETAERVTGSSLHRGEVMRLVAEIEAALGDADAPPLVAGGTSDLRA
jgi:hypothetical protein